MEFMNVGGGELLIIILLALVLFSPEDILKLMRTIGNYARTARQMWSNVSKSLQNDYIPDEVKEVVKETATTVKEAKSTISGVRENLSSMSTEVEEDISKATEMADNEVKEAVKTINPVTPAAKNMRESDSSQEVDSAASLEVAVPATTVKDDSIDETLEPSEKPATETFSEDIFADLFVDDKAVNMKDIDEETVITKTKPSVPSAIHHNNGSEGLAVKLAKTVEDSLKDDSDDS